MAQNDFIQRFIFENAPVKGEIVHLETTFQDIINKKDYPPMVEQLLGEALISTLLIVSSIKFKGSLSLQFQGDQRLPLLLVQTDENLNIRACVRFQENLATEEYAESFLTGKMALTITQDNQTQSYQSIVPIGSTSMAENLMFYFAQSEQISTKIWLAAESNRAAGIMLQLMPGGTTEEREHFWEYAVQIGETITPQELINLNNETLLHRLYHEEDLRLFDKRNVRFQCRCSQEKMRQVLLAIGEKEARDIISEQGKIEVECDFCNKKYYMDIIDLEMLFLKP